MMMCRVPLPIIHGVHLPYPVLTCEATKRRGVEQVVLSYMIN